MTDGLAHGVDQIGTFEPIQLWAGEPNGQTTQGTAAAGHIFGLKNARGETYKFPVVALVGGVLVPWNPLADSDNPNAWATGTVTFSTAVPTAGETVTVNGDVFTFRAAVDADTAYEVAIGATLTETATNLTAAINLNRMNFGVESGSGVIATSSAGVVTVKSAGVAGNAVTLAEAGANIAVSGGTLSGGTDSDAESGGARVPYGILPHALDTSATGYDAPVDTPVFISGHPNFDALDLPDGTTYQEIKAAFAGTMVNVQRLL
ncbi:MAG TPA: hypothetical protein PKZ08_13235 [Vicinamibacterales bacterium]|nr:hypothetical protein [Vicinamibacterales bacterium]